MNDVVWAGSMPEIYDRALGPGVFAPYARHVALQAAELAPARVLEVAAGTGLVTAELARELPLASVIATDLNEGMVTYGRARVPQVEWRAADAQALPFPSESFDLVLCQFGAMFFPDKAGAFAEMARVLAPQGRVLLTIWDGVATHQVATALMTALAAVLPDDPPSFIVRIPHGYADPGVIRADLSAGGLVVTSLDRVVLTGAATPAATLAQGFCQGTPLRSALEQRGSLAELTNAVADEMTRLLGGGPVAGEMAAYVVTAVTRPAP